jgi:xanthine dehydrogenase YagS FAD-binding subunit
MKSFEMIVPSSLEEAVDALDRNAVEPANEQKKRILAGGQDRLTELKDHLAEPDTVVNIKGVEELDAEVHAGADGGLRLGALASLASVARNQTVRERFPVLAEAAGSIASPQVRTLATVAGNLCQRPRCWYYRNEQTVCLKKGGDECFAYSGLNRYNAILGGGPSYIVHPSDLAPALVALDAVVATDRREIAVGDFFTLPAESDPTRETVLGPDEIIREIRVPASAAAPAARSTYVKFKERESYDFALSAVALRLRMNGSEIAEARMCLGGVAPIPWRCRSTEALLVGREIGEGLAVEAGQDALRGAEPLEFNGYKIPLTKALIAKALRALA